MKSRIGRRGETVLRTGVWSLVSKASAAASYLLSIPLAYTSLEPSPFGVWATLVSIVAFSTFLDFGIGNGCMNLMASAHGRGDNRQVAAVFRQGLRVLLVIALALLIAILLAADAMSAAYYADTTYGPATMAAIATAVAAAVISAPLSLGLRARLATGRGDSAFKWQAIGHAGALTALALASVLDAGLWGFTCAAVLPPLAAAAGNALAVSVDPHFRRPALLRRPERRELTRAIVGEGFLFFVLQAAAALTFSADLLLISWTLGPEEAGHFGVSQRIFSIVPMGLALLWAPLWPIYRSALASGDRAWVSRTLKRSIGLAFAGAAAACPLLVYFHSELLEVFAPGHPGAPMVLLAGFAIWTMMEAVGTAIATFLNSASVLRFQLVSATALALVSIGLKLWVLQLGNADLMPWATVAAYALLFVVPLAIFWRGIWRESMARAF